MKKIFYVFVGVLCLYSLYSYLYERYGLTSGFFLAFTVSVLSVLMFLQGLFTLYGMIYAWERPENIKKNRSPKKYKPPFYSFSIIVPALHEEKVIAQTIKAISDIDYPDLKKEILIVCRADDKETISKAKYMIDLLGKENIKLLIPNFRPKNKPDKLNYALSHATKDIVCVFDAEDEPHKNILNIINTVYLRDRVDVVQSGVQLMNFKSNWFSTLNVLEYYFWFKSTLQYYTTKGLIPLGGNTVFFKKDWLEKVGGWDPDCLTEDGEIGIRMSSAGARIRVIYDEEHATQEETPHSVSSFVKQRTRWAQGFIQTFFKGDWKNLPSISQRLLSMYILLGPQIQALYFLYIPFSIVMIISVKLPVVISIITSLPLYILVLQYTATTIGAYEFTKNYGFKFPLYLPFKLAITYFPYQIILGFSAFRSVLRLLNKNNSWEKTYHSNLHRENQNQVATQLQYEINNVVNESAKLYFSNKRKTDGYFDGKDSRY